MRVCVFVQEEQAAKLKADNIRVALEKIKEAQVKKVSEEKENEAAKILLCVQLGACSIFCGCPYAARFLGQVSVTPHRKLWSITAVVIINTRHSA